MQEKPRQIYTSVRTKHAAGRSSHLAVRRVVMSALIAWTVAVILVALLSLL